jgi:hypothetical protein
VRPKLIHVIVVADVVEPTGSESVPGRVFVEAREEEPTPLNWSLHAIALCANVAP